MNTKAIRIAIASMKGGVGKTAITQILARYFVEIEGRKVLVVDFDGRGGLTSVLYHHAITIDSKSVVEFLQVASLGSNPEETFQDARIKLDVINKFKWEDNGGALYLLPCKPFLDDLLPLVDSSLLGSAFDSISIKNDFIIIIDSGPDHLNVSMSAASSDIIFQPLIFSRQDVHPAVETLRAILIEQRTTGKPYFGGFLINKAGDTQWENRYLERYRGIVKDFRSKYGLICPEEDLLIPFKHSRIIQRGNHISWSWNDDILKSVKQMAERIQSYSSNLAGE